MKKLILTLLVATIALSLVACGKGKGNEATPTESEVVENAEDAGPYTPENSDFIYSDETMKEIVGITDQCTSNMVIIFPASVDKISNVSIPGGSNITTVIFRNDQVELENVNFIGSNVAVVENLPKTMTSIPASMFYGCTKLTTIGDTEGVIKLPSNITTIESDAFGGCTRITSVDASNVTTIADKAFEGCILLKDFVWSDKLESISELSFYMCGFTEFSLPNSIKNVAEHAFALNTSLISYEIPEGATVAENAFEGCKSIGSEAAVSENTTETTEKEETATTEVVD